MGEQPIDGLDDVGALNLLHDGTVVALARPQEAPDDLLLTVQIDYLRARLQPPGSAICVRLVGCSTVAYEPYEGEPVQTLAGIAACEPDIVEVVREGDSVRIWGGGGCLILRYDDLAITLDDGRPLAREELAATARSYWTEWAEKNGQ